jgi:hypothetical protein
VLWDDRPEKAKGPRLRQRLDPSKWRSVWRRDLQPECQNLTRRSSPKHIATTVVVAVTKRERFRRLLYGDTLKVLRDRYGPEFPETDDAKDDLILLLRLTAVSEHAAPEKMQHIVDLYAPWAKAEAQPWIDDFLSDDPRRVWLDGKELGQRLPLKNALRERLKVWRIIPADMTADRLADQRKAKDRARKRNKRRSRADYLAASINTRKPWIALGISRRTYFRRVAPSPSASILFRGADEVGATPTKRKRRKASKGKVGVVSAMSETGQQPERPFSPKLSSSSDALGANNRRGRA